MSGKKIQTFNCYCEDLSVGDWFVTAARTVTEADLVAFSGLSGDYTPIHTDEEFSKTSMFGRRIAHGCLTLSIATGLEFQTMCRAEGNRVLAFYGMDGVRFSAPVHIGDTIHLKGQISEIVDKGAKGGVITIGQSIVNQNGTVVASLVKKILNAKRPTAAEGAA